MKKYLIPILIVSGLCCFAISCKKKTCPAYSNGKVDDKPNYKKGSRKAARLF